MSKKHKSAPALRTSQNSAELLPEPEPAGAGAGLASKPIGHFIRHAYDANGELMSNDAS